MTYAFEYHLRLCNLQLADASSVSTEKFASLGGIKFGGMWFR